MTMTDSNMQPPDMKYCPYCGERIRITSKFCKYCGKKHGSSKNTTEPATIECTECGSLINKESKFCKYCGSKITSRISSPGAREGQQRTHPRFFRRIGSFAAQIWSGHRRAVLAVGILSVLFLIVMVIYIRMPSGSGRSNTYNSGMQLANNNTTAATSNGNNNQTTKSTNNNQYANDRKTVDTTSADPDASKTTAENTSRESGTESIDNASVTEEVYSSITNPSLHAAVDTATVSINGVVYEDLTYSANLSDYGILGLVTISDIDNQYEIQIHPFFDISKLYSGSKLTSNDFTNVSSGSISVTGFYTDERDWTDINIIIGGTISTGYYGSYEIFDKTDLIFEEYDTEGFMKVYFHIVMSGPTSGKTYDVEGFFVRDFTNVEKPVYDPNNHVCISCVGSGKCSLCGGKGTKRFYDAVKKGYSEKTCSTCHGTGVCYLCKGTGKP